MDNQSRPAGQNAAEELFPRGFLRWQEPSRPNPVLYILVLAASTGLAVVTVVAATLLVLLLGGSE